MYAAPSKVSIITSTEAKSFDIPIAIGLRSGHVSHENVTLTFGVEAELAVGEIAQLEILEPAVKR